MSYDSSYDLTETYEIPGGLRPYTRITRKGLDRLEPHYRSMGIVRASVPRGKNGIPVTVWANRSDCVMRPPTGPYLRKIDFIDRWARHELVQESRRFFPGGNMLALVSLFGTPEGAEKLSRWEHAKDVLLDIAIERCLMKTGKRIERVEE